MDFKLDRISVESQNPKISKDFNILFIDEYIKKNSEEIAVFFIKSCLDDNKSIDEKQILEKSKSEGTFLIARFGAVPHSFVFVTKQTIQSSTDKWIMINAIATEPRFRNKGTATILLGIVLRAAKERGFSFCSANLLLSNEKDMVVTEKLFAKFGFKPQQRIEKNIELGINDTSILKKSLKNTFNYSFTNLKNIPSLKTKEVINLDSDSDSDEEQRKKEDERRKAREKLKESVQKLRKEELEKQKRNREEEEQRKKEEEKRIQDEEETKRIEYEKMKRVENLRQIKEAKEKELELLENETRS